MSRVESFLIHAATLLVSVTGLALLIMKYFMPPIDPFAVIHHPLQPWALRLHLITAPLMVFGLGLLLRRHALGKLGGGLKDGRRSGLGLMLTAAPMVMSGYFIQIAVEETSRVLAIWVHVLTGLLYFLAYLAHGLVAWRAYRVRRNVSRGELDELQSFESVAQRG